MKTLHDKLVFAEEQLNAVRELEKAFGKCLDLGVEFVFDHTINKLCAINLKDAIADYSDNVDEDTEMLPFPTNIDEIEEMEDCIYEIDGSYSFYHDEIDNLVFTHIK